jgi:hypothetical protein
MKMETLPCGCEMGNNGDTFYYRPCSLLCEYYLYVITESKRKGIDWAIQTEE